MGQTIRSNTWNNNEKYFMFQETVVNSSGDSVMIPRSSILSMTPAAGGSARLYYENLANDNNEGYIDITHTHGTFEAFCLAFIKILNTDRRDPVIVVGDGVNGVFIVDEINDTAVTI